MVLNRLVNSLLCQTNPPGLHGKGVMISGITAAQMKEYGIVYHQVMLRLNKQTIQDLMSTPRIRLRKQYLQRLIDHGTSSSRSPSASAYPSPSCL